MVSEFEVPGRTEVHSPDSPVSGAFAATVVEQAVHADLGTARPRYVSPPDSFDKLPARSRYAYDLLAEERAPAAAPAPEPVIAHEFHAPRTERDHSGNVEDDFDAATYDLLRRRDIAKEVLRSRLVALAEQREHRSAYELVFLMLAFAVMVLLAAPPLVQVLLAARGIQN